MEFDAFRITQRGGADGFDIYVSTIRAGDLIGRISLDHWGPENPQGYQRQPEARRLRDKRGGVLRYLLREIGCFPTSILLNVRGEAAFKPERDLGWCQLGKLDVGDERLWLIDGQHRIEALRLAIERNTDFEDYPIIVSILRRPERFDELMLFYIVNRRQRSVSTDLAYRHLQRMLWERGSAWLYDFEGPKSVRLGLASEVVDELNGNPSSPWYGRIRRVGEAPSEDRIAADSVFTSSISEVLKEKAFVGVPVRDFASGLSAYWEEIRRLYQRAFEEPAGFTILSPAGIRAFNHLFAKVYTICLREGPVTGEAMARHVNGLLAKTPGHEEPAFRRPLGVGFWSKEKANARVSEMSGAELGRSLAAKIELAAVRPSPA